MGEVSLWLTQKLNASMEEHEETSELRDGEDDHDINNDNKLEGNSSSGRYKTQVTGHRSQVTGHCFTNTESIPNTFKS